MTSVNNYKDYKVARIYSKEQLLKSLENIYNFISKLHRKYHVGYERRSFDLDINN